MAEIAWNPAENGHDNASTVYRWSADAAHWKNLPYGESLAGDTGSSLAGVDLHDGAVQVIETSSPNEDVADKRDAARADLPRRGRLVDDRSAHQTRLAPCSCSAGG